MFSEVQLGDSFWQHPAGAGILDIAPLFSVFDGESVQLMTRIQS
jgi:hypothetical protein